ncbi:MMPL family transporter [Streptomyces sp. NWU339]|uniref:MMPL family transporter n=1 Tax=Streptomyces sp. NWU339 TaxID=2185284 RepID=UPI000D676965|nr:MMPL family transporter [Streptomyces sp. NWU339]PWI12138.1 MMPL family transporter [Streptomyces sp. NWU339]
MSEGRAAPGGPPDGPVRPGRPTRGGEPRLPTWLSRLTGRHRWPLAVLWLLLLGVAGWQAAPLPGLLSGGGWYVSGSGSAVAAERLTEGFTGRGATSLTLVVKDTRHRAGDPAFDTRVREAAEAVLRDDGLRATGGYGYTTLTSEGPRAAFLGEDGRTATIRVGSELDDGTARRVLPGIQEELSDRFEPKGLQVSLVSQAALWGEVNHLSERGLIFAELVTLPLILLVLLLLFRSVAAALAALLVGVTSVVFALAVLAVVAGRTELSVFVQNAATMLGLGVGVDYSLFMIMRFKSELRAGEGPASRANVERALTRTLRTSGETVVASGLTIMAAMSTLFLVDLSVIQSMALGVVVVVAFSVLTSVLLLPVLLHVLGPGIEWGRIGRRKRDSGRTGTGRGRSDEGRAEGSWVAVTRAVMRRPVLFLVVGVAALTALALPALRLETFTPDARVVPADAAVRQGYDAVRDEFGVGGAAPLQVVVSSDTPLQQRSGTDVARLLRFHDTIAGLPGVVRTDSAIGTLRQADRERPFAALAGRDRLPGDARATVDFFVSRDGRTTLVEVVGDDTASSDAARKLLSSVRAEAAGFTAGDRGWTVDVGGETAEGVDANKVIEDGLVPVIATMLGVIYLLLLITFRSVFLPLKAIAMNLLSVGATYGVLVLVFQDGLGNALFGFDVDGHLTNFVPVLLVTLLFSLSTDYEVFLLSRVREDYVVTGDDIGSVARGMSATMPLISGAAILMVAVFAAFAFTGILPIQQLGLGMALAIALDATVVRLLIVPASMRLMSRVNWWLPGRGNPAARPLTPQGAHTPVQGAADHGTTAGSTGSVHPEPTDSTKRTAPQ